MKKLLALLLIAGTPALFASDDNQGPQEGNVEIRGHEITFFPAGHTSEHAQEPFVVLTLQRSSSTNNLYAEKPRRVIKRSKSLGNLSELNTDHSLDETMRIGQNPFENINPTVLARLIRMAKNTVQVAGTTVIETAATGVQHASNGASATVTYIAQTNAAAMFNRRLMLPVTVGLNSLRNQATDLAGDFAGVIDRTPLDALVRSIVTLPPAFQPGGNSLASSTDSASTPTVTSSTSNDDEIDE